MALADFWNRVDKTPSCWIWRGALGSDGYGAIQIAMRSKKTHRVSWEMAHGAIPDGMCVLHQCDNRACVKPGHLFLGTRLDNNRDRVLKGRSASGDRHGTHTHPEVFRGTRVHTAKLTEEQVRLIRSSSGTQVGLAERFGVSRRTIRSIRDGSKWGWLP